MEMENKSYERVLRSDFLCAKVLLDGERVVRAALDRRVVGHNDALASVHAADARHHARRRHPALLGDRCAFMRERAFSFCALTRTSRRRRLCRQRAAKTRETASRRPPTGRSARSPPNTNNGPTLFVEKTTRRNQKRKRRGLTRSRASSLPRAVWRSRSASGPPAVI